MLSRPCSRTLASVQKPSCPARPLACEGARPQRVMVALWANHDGEAKSSAPKMAFLTCWAAR